jgi:hypothetical protein
LADVALRFAGKYIHAVYAVSTRSPLLRGCAEAIKPAGEGDVLQPDLGQISEELCLRQSAGDSTCPQVDIAADVLREFHVQRDVGQVQATSGLKHAHNFREGAFFLGDQVEYPVGDDDIDAAI